MLSRTWALWGKSRAIGLILLASWLCACVAVIGTVKSGLMVYYFSSTRTKSSNAPVVCSRRYSISTDGSSAL